MELVLFIAIGCFMGFLKLVVLIEEGYRANRLVADRRANELIRRKKAKQSWDKWRRHRLAEKITKAKAKLFTRAYP